MSLDEGRRFAPLPIGPRPVALHPRRDEVRDSKKALEQSRKTTIKKRKAPTRTWGPFKKSGGDLLSQGGTPKYHRRWWA